MQDVWVKKIGTNKGAPRIFFDGLQAIRAGFLPGEKISVEIEGKAVVIAKQEDGSRVVSSRKSKDKDLPVVDINSAQLLAIFEGMDSVRVVVARNRVYLLPLASEARKLERLDRLKAKMQSGEPLAAGSLAHGGGVLAHAIHTGLKDAGIQCELAFANELRDDLLAHASEHNDTWSEGTRALALPMQELAQDEWLLSNLPKLEILEMGLPCSGASLAGHTKGELTMMEDHEEVGHLVYSALAILSKTNPAVVLFENVPRYAKTASSQILRHQLRDMGYSTHEAILNGADFGCLEKRERWTMVAVTRGMTFSFEDLRPQLHVVRHLGEMLDDSIAADDPRWRAVQYLKDKQERNAAAGHGFQMQFVDPQSTGVPTLRKHYFKGGSPDPRLRHPTDPELSRLLTSKEHARIKGVPERLIEGLSETIAHQLLGQGIVYEPFRAVGERVGQSLLAHHAPAASQDSAEDAQQASQVTMRRQRSTG